VGIAVDSSGDVYVVDTFNSRIEKFSNSGSYLMQFGSGRGSGPGQLSGPNSVAVDSAGNVFVTDEANFRVEEFAPSGAFSSMFGSNGTGPGQFTAAFGIAVDASGNVYVVDGAHARVEAFTRSGTFLFQLPCTTGACPTGSGSGQLNVPDGIAITSSGLMYVTDVDNNQVDEFSISQTTATQSLSSMLASSNQTAPSSNLGLGNITGSPSQTDLLLVGVIIVLIALIAMTMLRRRRARGPSTRQVARANLIYCEQCGAQSSAEKQFCEKCGAKLKP
jgi:sugar lactone lactonase YvrE